MNPVSSPSRLMDSPGPWSSGFVFDTPKDPGQNYSPSEGPGITYSSDSSPILGEPGVNMSSGETPSSFPGDSNENPSEGYVPNDDEAWSADIGGWVDKAGAWLGDRLLGQGLASGAGLGEVGGLGALLGGILSMKDDCGGCTAQPQEQPDSGNGEGGPGDPSGSGGGGGDTGGSGGGDDGEGDGGGGNSGGPPEPENGDGGRADPEGGTDEGPTRGGRSHGGVNSGINLDGGFSWLGNVIGGGSGDEGGTGWGWSHFGGPRANPVGGDGGGMGNPEEGTDERPKDVGGLDAVGSAGSQMQGGTDDWSYLAGRAGWGMRGASALAMVGASRLRTGGTNSRF
jgi:hypothetical protein